MDPAEGNGEKRALDGEDLVSNKKLRKNRFQVRVLQDAFYGAQHPSAARKAELADQTGLTFEQVQAWFANRRAYDSCRPSQREPSDENSIDDPMEDPEAEVIALSPKTLLATNRFVCEICGKGFQRDQNLQLHRRGHNLPWKLRQRSSKEPRKRVYVCPEPTCIHHNPARALGDLTGIKKHFCRKHGEKKWKCDKCSKRYAVQSDWKAHSKTCGTREYRCDCGTLFSRRDSFITHRAFCDALAQETARVTAAFNNVESNMLQQFPMSHIKASVVHGEAADHEVKQRLALWMGHGSRTNDPLGNNTGFGDMHQVGPVSAAATLYGDLLNSPSNLHQLDQSQLSWVYGDKLPSSSNMGAVTSASLPATSAVKEAETLQPLLGSLPVLFSSQQHHLIAVSDTSATALLQKAAQIGVTSTVPFTGSFEPPKCQNANVHDRFDGLFSSRSQASNLENIVPNFAVSNTFDVYAARHGSPPRDDVGGETRDFLGVGVHTLSQPSINGWI
ncbi:Leucine rich repeat N-terminal domain [Musa troglodytarum]|nr:Leucine rich repeat N-terminal domain [Musa troglodytarum]